MPEKITRSSMSLIVPTSHHCTATVTFRGGPKRWELLNRKFSEFQLMDRARESQFGHFFSGQEFKFCGQLIHALLLRKVISTREDEIQILLGRNVCRFGRREFGLMSGLRFDANYTDDDWSEFTRSRRLVETYFPPEDTFRFSTLEAIFTICRDMEDVWRLGLVYFVEGILLGNDDTSFIWTDVLYLVDVPQNFFRYPWGKKVFKPTLQALKKDMESYCAGRWELGVGDDADTDEDGRMKGKKKLKVDKSGSKYTLHGWIPSLQYWAFETAAQLGAQFATHAGERFPRMMSWTNNKAPNAVRITQVLKERTLEVRSFLQPRPVELEYIRANQLEEVHAPANTGDRIAPAHPAPANTGDRIAPAHPDDITAPAHPDDTAAITMPELASTFTGMYELRRSQSLLMRDVDELRRSQSQLVGTVQSQHMLLQSHHALLQAQHVLLQSLHEKFDNMSQLMASAAGSQPTTDVAHPKIHCLCMAGLHGSRGQGDPSGPHCPLAE